jgi:hypothetical protein
MVSQAEFDHMWTEGMMAKSKETPKTDFLSKDFHALNDDPVNHPSHYTQGGIECIDAIKASMTEAEFRGFLKGQVIKYIWRYELKGKPGEDLNKADFYLKRLRKEVGEG